MDTAKVIGVIRFREMENRIEEIDRTKKENESLGLEMAKVVILQELKINNEINKENVTTLYSYLKETFAGMVWFEEPEFVMLEDYVTSIGKNYSGFFYVIWD